MAAREIMVQHLKAVVIPVLRHQGFKGAFPHFRRINSDKINLLTFQFDNWGGGFVIEVGNAPNKDFTTSWGEIISAGKLTVHDLNPNERLRIQHNMATPNSSTDDWFRFDNAVTTKDIEKICNDVVIKLEYARKYWSEDSRQ